MTEAEDIRKRTNERVQKLNNVVYKVNTELTDRKDVLQQLSNLYNYADKFGVEEPLVNNLQKALEDYLDVIIHQNKLEFYIPTTSSENY